MSILFGCVVKHVWEYRSPIHLYIWPEFWLSAAESDQWFVVKLPLLMINIRTERATRSFNPWLKVTCLWLTAIALKWVKNKNHSISNSKSLMTFRIKFLLEVCFLSVLANLFRAKKDIFQQQTQQKRLWFPTDVVPNWVCLSGLPSRASRCLFARIRKSLVNSTILKGCWTEQTPHHHIIWPNKIKGSIEHAGTRKDKVGLCRSRKSGM